MPKTAKPKKKSAQKSKCPLSHGVRFTDEDLRIIGAVQEKLGLNLTSVVRMGLRSVAREQGINL